MKSSKMILVHNFRTHCMRWWHSLSSNIHKSYSGTFGATSWRKVVFVASLYQF